MKIKDGFVIREVAGKYMVIATGEASKDFHGMISLNETAAAIWKGLSEGNDMESISTEIAHKYGISVDEATEDVNKLIEQMEKAGFLC